MRRWHVVFTHPRQERQALQQLQQQGYEAWLPLLPAAVARVPAPGRKSGQRAQSAQSAQSASRSGPAKPARAAKKPGAPARPPLFPRYLFVHVDSNIENTAPIRSTLGCCGLVRFGHRLAVLPDAVLESLQSRCAASAVEAPAPEDRWQRGDCLRVTDGPFAGFEAVFEARSGAERVAVLLNWLGSLRPVQMPAAQLVAVAS